MSPGAHPLLRKFFFCIRVRNNFHNSEMACWQNVVVFRHDLQTNIQVIQISQAVVFSSYEYAGHMGES